MFSKKCKLHLEEAKMTRWQHFKHALWVSWQLEKAAYACFIHAFAPRFFTTYASDKCKEVLKKPAEETEALKKMGVLKDIKDLME